MSLKYIRTVLNIGVLILGFNIVSAPAHGQTSLYARDMPPATYAKLSELSSYGQTVKKIRFVPGGGWIVLYGHNSYYADDLPYHIVNYLDQLAQGGHEIKSMAFSPNGGAIILYDWNHFYVSGSVPLDLIYRMNELANGGNALNDVVMTPSGGWAVIGDRGANYWSGVPYNLGQRLIELSRSGLDLRSLDIQNNNWVLLFGYREVSWDLLSAEAIGKIQEVYASGLISRTFSFAPYGGWALIW
jgi:hypothetical protein